MTYEVKKQIKTVSGYQMLTITEFLFSNSSTVSPDQILEQFIHSKHFSFESLPEAVRMAPADNLYLRQAFDPDKISVKDFKKFNGELVKIFLTDMLNKPTWKNDKADFIVLFNRYFELQTDLENGVFYVISMNWFDVNDERLRDPENMIYDYYFLIISINQKTNMLKVNEWLYD